LDKYYIFRDSLLYNGFSQKPYARYICSPAFDAEYAFSVEKIEEKNYIISNGFSINFWSAVYDKTRDTLKINTSTRKVEINDDLYQKIGELFELLAEQTKTTERFIGFDGETYYFSTTDKNGEIRIGKTWSPPRGSLLDKLVDICNKLYSLKSEDNISSQSEILEEIDKLINDLIKQ